MVNIKKWETFLISAISLLLTGCDSGNIDDEDILIQNSGKTVKVTATIRGIGQLSDTYTVAVAAFSDDKKYATTQRAIPENTADGQHISVTLDNLSSEISTVELALTNKLRKRILTLASIDINDFESGGDTIRMDLGSLSVDMFGCIQKGIFNVSCIQCHGANGRSAGNLNLTDGNPPTNLVDVDAQSSVAGQGYKRIVSGNPEESLMFKILNPGGENILHYNHTEVLSSQFKNNLAEVKTLLRDWIENLQ